MVNPGATESIAFINASSVVQDADAQKWMAALQKQVSHDYLPVWGHTTHLHFIAKGHKPPDNMAWLALLDDSDQAGALGYHDVTNNGMPLGKVFAKTDLQYNETVSVTASHELIEMLGDPYIQLSTIVQDRNTTMAYAWELCDACEDERFAYEIDGVKVSDFVYPAWFEAWRTPNSAQFDHMNMIQRPFELLVGGYIGVWYPNSGWTQLNAQEVPTFKQRPKVGARRERRRLDRSGWYASTVK